MPRVDNVPKYTTWMMATENTHVQVRTGRVAQNRGGDLTAAILPTQEEVQRRLLYADKEGEMVPGTDSEAEELMVCGSRSAWGPSNALPQCLSGAALTSPTQTEDPAEQRSWSRQEDFVLLGVMAVRGNKPVCWA